MIIYPVPAVLVTSGDMENSNILTVAWTGIINTNPATVYISVRPERYSYNLIKKNKEFVINLTNENLVCLSTLGCIYLIIDESINKLNVNDIVPPILDAI